MTVLKIEDVDRTYENDTFDLFKKVYYDGVHMIDVYVNNYTFSNESEQYNVSVYNDIPQHLLNKYEPITMNQLDELRIRFQKKSDKLKRVSQNTSEELYKYKGKNQKIYINISSSYYDFIKNTYNPPRYCRGGVFTNIRISYSYDNVDFVDFQTISINYKSDENDLIIHHKNDKVDKIIDGIITKFDREEALHYNSSYSEYNYSDSDSE